MVHRIGVVTADSPELPAARFGLRDWDVQVHDGTGWRTVATVRGNTTAGRSSTFPARTTRALRILALAANGVNDQARLTEVTVS